MNIKHKINGKEIELPNTEAEISIDISNGKDYLAETTHLHNNGAAHIINSHINPELKNEFNEN